MRSRRWLGGWAVSLATAVLTAYPPNRLTAQSREVLLATTTSTRDAGLLDSLLPVFQRQTGYRVKVIAVGSGQALAMGRRGDADVVDRKSTRLNSSHLVISYAVFCLKKKKKKT